MFDIEPSALPSKPLRWEKRVEETAARAMPAMLPVAPGTVNAAAGRWDGRDGPRAKGPGRRRSYTSSASSVVIEVDVFSAGISGKVTRRGVLLVYYLSSFGHGLDDFLQGEVVGIYE